MKRFPASFAFCGMAVCALFASSALAQSTSLRATDHLTVPQWVNPATPGQLEGRVLLPSTDGSSRPIADAVVAMTNRDGETVRSRTDDAGRFVMLGVEPGVYALTARAKGAFACCAMHVVSNDMASAEMLPRTVDVAAAGIDYTVIKTSILRYLPPVNDENPYSIVGADLKGISSRVVGENLFRVSQTDGGLKGRILVAGAQGSTLGDAGLLNVFLVSKGDVIDRVISKKSGAFEFENVAPGEYAILAIGQSGLGMAGFELVDTAKATQVSKNKDDGAQAGRSGDTLVSNYVDAGCCCSEFSMQIAPLPQAIECVESVIYEEVIPVEESIVADPAMAVDQFGNPIGGVDQFGNPIGGAGFGDPGLGSGLSGGGAGGGGFAGGGGGFGGGGGGFGGGLGGLASLAALAAIAGNDNNNDPLVTPPRAASPPR